MAVEFCPKCGNPIGILDAGDPSRLCSICAWFGDGSETLTNPPVTCDIETSVRQAIALYRDACRNELLLEAAYQRSELPLSKLLRVHAKIADSEASLLTLFSGLQSRKTIIARDVDGLVQWPETWTIRRYNACNEPCDMLVGPCACGAWHTEGEDWVQAALRINNAVIENQHER